VQGKRYVRVNIYDDKAGMLAASVKRSGFPHNGESACTLSGIEPPECLADLFFYWRGLRPNVITHEAVHAADAVVLALGAGVGPDNDELRASWADRIVEKVWLKSQGAPL
jgi:hypothetical protein